MTERQHGRINSVALRIAESSLAKGVWVPETAALFLRGVYEQPEHFRRLLRLRPHDTWGSSYE